jgi:hypothetical protein
MKKRALGALGVVKAFAEFAPPGLKFRLEVAPSVGKADSGDPEDDLADLLDEIGQVARAGGRAVFLIDELQNLDSPSLAAISMAFQRMVKKNLPVALVGAGLPSVSDGLFAAKGWSGIPCANDSPTTSTVAVSTRARTPNSVTWQRWRRSAARGRFGQPPSARFYPLD